MKNYPSLRQETLKGIWDLKKKSAHEKLVITIFISTYGPT